MIITRTITRDVEYCGECPYYDEWHDMGAAIPMCLALVEGTNIGTGFLYNPQIISGRCPFKNKKKENYNE